MLLSFQISKDMNELSNVMYSGRWPHNSLFYLEHCNFFQILWKLDVISWSLLHLNWKNLVLNWDFDLKSSLMIKHHKAIFSCQVLRVKNNCFLCNAYFSICYCKYYTRQVIVLSKQKHCNFSNPNKLGYFLSSISIEKLLQFWDILKFLW